VVLRLRLIFGAGGREFGVEKVRYLGGFVFCGIVEYLSIVR